MVYSFFLKKENFKFSSAHFTIFDKTTSEALHGHNYRVGIRLKSSLSKLENEMICDFNIVKKIIKTCCDRLDEKVLLPTQSPFLKIQKSTSFPLHTHVIFAKKNYILPNEDIFFLETQNITSEALSYFIAQTVAPQLKHFFSSIAVHIEETRGQTASYSMTL